MEFRFGSCRLHAERRELRRANEPVPVEPQVFDLLLHLVLHRDRVVSRDELVEVVWKHRIVSESTIATRISSARAAIGDTGDAQRLIRTYARRGLRFVGEVVEERHPSLRAPVTSHPRLCIVPFEAFGGSPRERQFALGLFEELLAALARSSLVELRRRSAGFADAGHAVAAPEYILEGSVRRAGPKVRFYTRLTAPDGTIIWAERLQGSLRETFELQDEIALRILGAVTGRVEENEIARVARRPPASLDAYEQYLRALGSIRRMTEAGNDEALACLSRALEIDPDYGKAAGLAAWAHTLRVALNWSKNDEEDERRGLALGRKAIRSAHSSADALAMGGYAIAALAGEIDEGLAAIEQSLEIEPDNHTVLTHAGWVYNYAGRHELAIRHLQRAVLVGRHDATLFRAQTALAYANVLVGDYEGGIAAATKAVLGNPNYTVAYRARAVALAHSGRISGARATIERLSHLTPNLSTRRLAEASVFRNSGGIDTILSGLRAAGVPR